ncbi:response regulator transcription factor [Brunnivagina elsteri]|uniref:DNA-binding response regulator n=1 Tax=Brunnivagina elsteri CCALA 953 TaxID=987040 RepID=A0A2A2TCP2_9CYAN|nr:response regulator transcription factor [Calothrix elsteri]PAX51189.1 DNA-binding response regulator [Calothrix elsteri CCALA 953]
MPSTGLKILLVEDDELFLLGLRVRLQQEPGLEVVGEAEDGETAIELVSQCPIDIVLLDVGLPGIGGIEACRQIKQQHPKLPVLILTSHSQQALISRLIEAGAQGYCLKGIPAEKLVLALRSVAAGASWWDETATKEIRSQFKSNSTCLNLEEVSNTLSSVNPLTQREQEILLLLAEGQTNQQIANVLYITSGTVRVHVHAILHKLEARDRTQAVTIAIQKGLITGDMSRLNVN